MIAIDHVTKSFHSVVAVNDLSLTVNEGEVLGVLGPNGAGKTTLFKLIAGLLRPDSGRITTPGITWPAIGYKPERLLFPNKMRVHKYLKMIAAISLQSSNQRVDEIVDDSLKKLNLEQAKTKRINDCSKGMRQRLALAQALIGQAPLLLFDEPSNGLDPEGQNDVCHLIKMMNAKGKTIILASHQLHEVTQVCSRLVILNRGKIHFESTMTEALTKRQYATIWVDQDLSPMALLLERLHRNLMVYEDHVVLNKDALDVRRQVMRILLGAGYDIVKVEESNVSLNEIYAEAVR